MAGELKNIVIALGFPKPPSNITAAQLFQKIDAKIKEIVKVVGKDALGETLLKGMSKYRAFIEDNDIAIYKTSNYR